MRRLVRWVTFGLTAAVTREDALRLARAACAAEGVTWREPAKALRDFGDWVVVVPADVRPHMRIGVDAGTGAVKGVARLPR